jgi:hypothetical protein
MRRVILAAVAIVLAGSGMSFATPAKAAAPDVAKWQPCHYEAMPSGKVRYSVDPKASFEVDELRIADKRARVDASGTFYRVMPSQELAGKHWVYLDVFGEAQGFSTWARCKPLYP